jgi:hypothetical protein
MDGIDYSQGCSLCTGVWLERKLLRKQNNELADTGKVLGGFASSAFVHSFAARTVIGGAWSDALGEAKFFAINGLAIVVEEGVKRLVLAQRKKGQQKSLHRWYDGAVGRVWWVTVLLLSGRNFARGWVKAGLVREMSFL